MEEGRGRERESDPIHWFTSQGVTMTTGELVQSTSQTLLLGITCWPMVLGHPEIKSA